MNHTKGRNETRKIVFRSCYFTLKVHGELYEYDEKDNVYGWDPWDRLRVRVGSSEKGK